jgi:ATP-dependent DNA helicase RecQ
MNAATRRANQEQWMSDTVRVLVGTIAFGLGINKATVRAVIHLSLPKSIEQYYQEAGRAGRDGEPADCVLLWRKQDHFLLKHFIEQIVDRGEYTRARERYRTMCRFVESAVCRQRQICVHFGETPKWERCELCDTCAGFPEWVEKRVTAPARPAAAAKPAAPTADSEMIEYFKEWRRTIAAAKKVPAYVVMHDATLVDLCRKKPRTLRELMGVSGIGSSKAQLYGESIIAALAEFQAGARAERRTTQVSSPVEETLAMLAEGRTLASIAQARGRRLETIVNTVALLVEQGRVSFREDWIPAERLRQISEAIGRLGGDRFKPLRDALPAEIPAEEIRLVLAGRKRAGA